MSSGVSLHAVHALLSVGRVSDAAVPPLSHSSCLANYALYQGDRMSKSAVSELSPHDSGLAVSCVT